MTIAQKIRAKLVICQVAQQNGISTARCRAAMAEAIRAAWDTGDPAIRQLAGEERMPTPEEFIYLISAKFFTKTT